MSINVKNVKKEKYRRNNQLKLQNLIEDNIECKERILNIMSEKGMED